MKKSSWKATAAAGLLIFCLSAGEAFPQPPSAVRETGRAGSTGTVYAGNPASKPAPSCICRTQEEIAWDLMMYGLQNIQPLRARIKDYDDLLNAYRRALGAVRGQGQ